MKLIDFDARFTAYFTEWAKANRKRFHTPDQMGDMMPAVYEKFLETPADWLDGKSPGNYFDGMDDPSALVEWMAAYARGGVPIPDPLLNRIAALKPACEAPLMRLALSEEADMESRMTAVGLLREIASRAPLRAYISWQLTREEDDELADSALESLRDMGDEAVPFARAAFDDATLAGREALLDLLTDAPCDEAVFQFALERFQARPDRRALYAGYLGKLGDERALPALLAAAQDPATDYIDFIELRNAIERLGGDAPERAFDDDPSYDALGKL